MTAEELELCGDRLDSVRDLLELLPNEIGSWKYAYWYKEIGRAHVRTPVTEKSRMPSSA